MGIYQIVKVFNQVKPFFIDAETLDGTTRLTNIQYTDDLQDISSQAYKNLTMSITEEVHIWFYKDYPVVRSLN